MLKFFNFPRSAFIFSLIILNLAVSFLSSTALASTNNHLLAPSSIYSSPPSTVKSSADDKRSALKKKICVSVYLKKEPGKHVIDRLRKGMMVEVLKYRGRFAYVAENTPRAGKVKGWIPQAAICGSEYKKFAKGDK